MEARINGRPDAGVTVCRFYGECIRAARDFCGTDVIVIQAHKEKSEDAKIETVWPRDGRSRVCAYKWSNETIDLFVIGFVCDSEQMRSVKSIKNDGIFGRTITEMEK